MKRRIVKMAWADFGRLEKRLVNRVINSGWISRHRYLPAFEQQVAKLHGQRFGVMVNSGTDALRIALATLKEVHRWPTGSQVIIPSITFVATVNAVLQNSLEPVFVDVDPRSFNMNFNQVADRLTSSTRAILAVHLFGLPADMFACMGLARKSSVRVVEDSCETMFVHKIQGDIAAFSTYMSHIIQTGVGGILTTNNPVYDKLARSYMNHGRSDDISRFEFERIGYSSRVTEFEAALGCAQLTRWKRILARRQAIAGELALGLEDLPVQLPGFEKPSSWMLFPLVLKVKSRDQLMRFLAARGIESRQMMPLINQAPYRHFVKKGQFPVAENINANGICLPCHQLLNERDVAWMIKSMRAYFQ